MDGETLRRFVESLEIPADERARLAELSPLDYTGLASSLTHQLDRHLDPD